MAKPNNQEKPKNEPTAKTTEPVLDIKPSAPVAPFGPVQTNAPEVSAPSDARPAAKPVDKSARAFDAVDYPLISCIGCNSTNTVRIDQHLKLPYHRRQCRACGKQFKEARR